VKPANWFVERSEYAPTTMDTNILVVVVERQL
jgi:hypothetical protein